MYIAEEFCVSHLMLKIIPKIDVDASG